MRRGGLHISAGAIVTIVIATVILILMAGFIERAWPKSETRFLEAIENQEPEAPQPTTNTPLTLSTSTRITSPGKTVGMKVKVRNEGPPRLLAPELYCGLGILEDIQVNPKQLDTGDVGSYLMIYTVAADAQKTDYLCSASAGDLPVVEWKLSLK